MREGITSRVTAADRPYEEFYDFYSVSPEIFESTHVYPPFELFTCFVRCNVDYILAKMNELRWESGNIRGVRDSLRYVPKAQEFRCHSSAASAQRHDPVV